MSKYLVSQEAINNVELQDLSPVLREVTEGKERWIYRYCDKKVIGRKAYRDFIDLNKRMMQGKDDTYAFSDDMDKEGVLSMTQAFQVVATALESFIINASDKEKVYVLDEKDQELGDEIKAKLLCLFDKIMAAVIQPDGGYRFDASPYLPNYDHFTEENYKFAFLDSMTWVLSVALCMFRLHIRGILELDAQRMDKAQKIYGYCLQYLTDSFIDGDEKNNRFDCGWNYTKGCKNPSLYFTFAVSELLIDVLDTFEDTVRAADLEFLQQEIETKLTDKNLAVKASSEEIDAKKKQAEKTYGKHRERLLSDTEAAKKERKLFAAINKGFGVYEEGSPYWTLERRVKKAAEKIWKLTQNKLAAEFFTGDLADTVSETVIEQSIQSDAVFNTIFIINTLINAGFDEDAADLLVYYTVNGSQAYEDALFAYDTVRDTLRIAYDNAYQLYLKMDKKKKVYKINEYTLSFDEEFKKLDDAYKAVEEKVSDLRKARIRVFSLMPLLVKTKTTLGEFLIQYPQYDMQIYLENILLHRSVSSDVPDEYDWTWERGSYSSSSNFYFLSALGDFFAYYAEYEIPASANAVANEEARMKVREEHLKELQKSNGAIGQLEADKKRLQREKEGLEAEKAQLEADYAELLARFNNDPLRKALNDFVCTVVREHILNMASVGDLLTGFANSLTASAQVRVGMKAAQAKDIQAEQNWYEKPVEEVPSETQKLEAGLSAFGSALISERLLEMMYADKLSTGEDLKYVQAGYPRTAQKVREDIAQALRYYLEPMASGLDHSVYVKSNGYERLVELLDQEGPNKGNKGGKG